MDDIERNERIRELNSERDNLIHRKLVYTSFVTDMLRKELVSDEFINDVNTQIEEINAKLFLLGQ